LAQRTDPPLLIAVTVLTSLDASDLAAIGCPGEPRQRVLGLATLARDAGLDGVVCSPQEAAPVRAALGPGFRLVTPGVRPAGAAVGDQKRVMTPAEARAAGADYLVIGRPITAAADPLAALAMIENELGS
jgi:orotidine-5'-phosphate decarboxylase